MPRSSYSDASKFSGRVHNEFDVLKKPNEGGPTYQAYSASEEADTDHKANFPKYPDFYYPDDSARDTYMQTKAYIAQNKDKFGITYSSPQDIQYIMDKRNMQELLSFKLFVENSIPRGTPWARDFFERILPGWYESKKDIIMKKIDILSKYAELTVTGIRSIDDMYLLWLLYTGRVVLPTDIQGIIRPTNQRLTGGWQNQGLFNPKRWIHAQARLSNYNLKHMANMAIPGVDLKGLTGNLEIRGSWNDGAAPGNTDAAPGGILYATNDPTDAANAGQAWFSTLRNTTGGNVAGPLDMDTSNTFSKYSLANAGGAYRYGGVDGNGEYPPYRI